MKDLKKKLESIDGNGYKGYKDIYGTYRGNWYMMHIDYVQPDPFANPSRIRIEVPKNIAKYNYEWIETKERKIAFEDFLTREVSKAIYKHSKNIHGTGKSGLISIDTPRQEILNRTSVKVDKKGIEFRLSIGLPARGRRISARFAIQMLYYDIPRIIKVALFDYNKSKLINHLNLVDNQSSIRKYLKDNGYISFIGNDSILPRENGISNKPLSGEDVVSFISPKSMEIEIPLPHGNPIKGMGIKKGISLIVGGGYHGKSTILKAIERGVYNHILGDGRDYVITDDTAFKIRAEDGRRIEKVNISPFISNLPHNKDTTRFSSEDGSGSTSQASNIIEALEMKSKVLLIDEDTSATNFMIRDLRMQKLVSKEKEPITPFIDKVRTLYNDLDVSTILVIGGSGDYFDVADNIIMMDEYKPIDVTLKAKEISKNIETIRINESNIAFGEISNRIIDSKSFDASKGSREKVDSKGLNTIIYGRNSIDLSYLEQLIDNSQTRAIAYMIKYISDKIVDDNKSLLEIINILYNDIESHSLDFISPYYGKHPLDLALPRKFEVASAINRLRTTKVK